MGDQLMPPSVSRPAALAFTLRLREEPGWRETALAAAISIAAVACAPTNQGRFDAQGFQHATYSYRVKTAASGMILSDSWLLDNYYFERGKVTPKNAPRYKTEYALDINGDGKVDMRRSALLYDLKFKHRQHDSAIFLRTFPVSTDQRDRELRVIMQDLVDDVAGAGYEAVQIRENQVAVIEKRFAATIVDRSEARLGGMDAYVATLDIANIDQIRVAPGARFARVQLVIARTPFRYNLDPKGYPGVDYPILMLAEYASMPEDFERDLPDFVDFLGRIAIDGVSGFTSSPVAAPPTGATKQEKPRDAESAAAPDGGGSLTAAPDAPPAASVAPAAPPANP